jgi:AcrR family transcriptional regulator
MVEKEEIRNQIISAARQIFSKYGYRKTSMEEIARKVKKGKSSIYYYFPGKEDIYKAVIEHEAELLKNTILKNIEPIDDPSEKLRIYVKVRMKTLKETVNYYLAIRSELLHNLDFINKTREKYDKEEVEILEALLKEGVKLKLFQVEDTNLAAIAIVTAMKGLEAPLFKPYYYRNYEDHIQHVLDILFYGIIKR